MTPKSLKKNSLLCFAPLILASFGCSPSHQGVENWLTNTHDGSALFEKQPALPLVRGHGDDVRTIEIDSSQRYQTIDGFGFTLTGGSAYHLMQMSRKARATLLQELFGSTGTDIGISYLRVSIGASDLNASPFSYDDLPDGHTDTEMTQFD